MLEKLVLVYFYCASSTGSHFWNRGMYRHFHLRSPLMPDLICVTGAVSNVLLTLRLLSLVGVIISPTLTNEFGSTSSSTYCQ